MYPNMCVKIAMCLALVACIDGHILKHHEVPLSPDGMILEITVRNKGEQRPVSLMEIDFNEKDKKVVMSMGGPATRAPKDVSGPTTDFVPSIGNRHGIRVGTCPLGYTRRGGFCFPDDDY